MMIMRLALTSLVMSLALPLVANAEPPPEPEAYVPGMGEIMGTTQMRHAKLWYAGQAKNWELATYEVTEIEEGLADAVKYHPVFKKNVPVAAMLDKFTAPPLVALRRTIATHDVAGFRQAFDSLTRACNGCHDAAGVGFINIIRPRTPPFGNQEFGGTK